MGRSRWLQSCRLTRECIEDTKQEGMFCLLQWSTDYVSFTGYPRIICWESAIKSEVNEQTEGNIDLLRGKNYSLPQNTCGRL